MNNKRLSPTKMCFFDRKKCLWTTKGIISNVLFCLLLLCGVTDSKGFFQSIGSAVSGSLQSVGHSFCSHINCCEFHLNDVNTMETILAENLHGKLYGQHIARDLIMKAVTLHRTVNPVKALGIGMHGWTGTGKNYVSQMIAKSVFKKGIKSPLVHVFAGEASFPVSSEVHIYKKNLINWIRGNVSQCGHSLFIFDECEKWPPTLLDVVRPFLDYHAALEGVDYRNAIFLFLTNSGGSVIGERVLTLHEEGVIREDLSLTNFHNGISLELFNEKGGFHKSALIRGDGIDFHIPFLPLEEKHVKQCVEDQFKLKGVPNPSPEMMKRVLDNMDYGPQNNPVFSLTGCKRIHGLVVEALSRSRYLTEL